MKISNVSLQSKVKVESLFREKMSATRRKEVDGWVMQDAPCVEVPRGGSLEITNCDITAAGASGSAFPHFFGSAVRQ